MARTTAAATAAATALFLGRDAARASALKPPFSEIYQTTTPPTTAADGVLDTGLYWCGGGEWTLVGTSCYLSTTGDKNYFDALVECDGVDGWPFTPANVDDLNSLYSFTTATKIWTGIKSTDGEPAWKDYFGNDPSFYSWPNPLSPADPASGQCISVEGEGEYFSRSCSTALETSTMVCTKLASLNDGGDTPVDSGTGESQPPASVNGGGGGSLGVPFNGEIALYRQFLDPSTGVENAYLYPELKFVEADEAIHRVGLTTVQGNSLSNLYASTYSSSSQGKVYYFQGEYSAWSVQQILTPSELVDSPKNHFGSSLALNKKANMNGQSFAERDPNSAHSNLNLQSPPGPAGGPPPPAAATMFVGCGNCSTVGQGKGAIYLYTQDPNAKTWSQSQQITISSNKISALGENQIVAYDDLLVADSSLSPVVFRKSPRGEYLPEQLIGVNSEVTMFDVYEDTIVYSVATANHKLVSGAGAVYILAPSKPAPADGKHKPEPVQWSQQQVLLAPVPTASAGFGNSLSLGENRLAIAENEAIGGNYNVYVFERETSTGKWSVQQQLQDSNGAAGSNVILSDSSLTIVHSGATVGYFNQFKTADCLVLSLEDQFGDGWDEARLEVTSPDGTRDYFHSRCDLPNPHRVRYCPRNVEDGGLYRFRVVDIEKSNGPPKNVWEIQWRVYNEDTATWVVGDWESKMDFEWDSVDLKFLDRKKDKSHTPNATCTYCRPRPTDKPTPVLRNRHLKGGGGSQWSTAGPTSTPAPTLEVTNIGNWRSIVLSGGPWFRTDRNGASYFVSDAKSLRLVTSGTLCPGEAAGKECWVDLPDGDYNIRVGGALLADPTSVLWTYCRIATPQAGQTQVSVRIADGSCSVLSHHRSSSFCLKTEGTATVAIELLVLGVSGGAGQLQSEDSAALVGALSSALKVASSDVHIVSSAVSVGGAHVTAEVDIHRSSGHDILEVEGIDDTVSSLKSYLQGEGHHDIWVGLLSSAHHTVFSQSSSVEFLSVGVVGSKDLSLVDSHLSVEEVVSYADQPSSNSHDPQAASISEQQVFEFVSLSGYAMAVGGLLVFLVGLMISARHHALPASVPAQPSSPKTDDSGLVSPQRRERVSLSTLYSSPPSTAALREFVNSEDKVLDMMLSQAQN